MVTAAGVRHPIVRMRRALRLIVATTAGALVACSSGSATPPDGGSPRSATFGGSDIPAGAPGIRGIVTQIVAGDSVVPTPSTGSPSTPISCPPACEPLGRRLRSVLVEEIPGTDAGGDKSVVTMLASARVLRRTARSVAPAGFAEFRVGQRVSVWFDGPVAESYPTQARGHVVVIEP